MTGDDDIERDRRDELLAGRHPATTGLLRWFDYAHLADHLQAVSRPVAELAYATVAELPDGPELTTGLRKLLEAKDCFVRQAIDAVQTRQRVDRETMTAGRMPLLPRMATATPDVDPPADGDRDRCAVALGGELRCRLGHGHLGVHETEAGQAFDR